MTKTLFLLGIAWLAPMILGAAPLRVDFSIPGRADAVAPGWLQWTAPNGTTAEQRFGAVVCELRAVEKGAPFTTVWWKGGAIDGNRMAVDAVTVTGSGATALELRIRGLTPGRHTVATFHNVAASPTGAPQVSAFDVLVDGTMQATGVRPTLRAGSDEDAAALFLDVTAKDAADVVIIFRNQETGAGPFLCGFELDGPNPLTRARKPLPADRDEHVDADAGKANLTWTSASGAVKHLVYVGTGQAAVERATPTSVEFHGAVTDCRYDVSELSNLHDTWWRVDEVDANGAVTPGLVWYFRPRHLAFPGAEGYGRFARGGRGGRVIEVTNLDDSGPGSLRDAIEADGARTIVFAVSGLITLKSKLVIHNPYVTVAGQTAPGKGITLRQYNFGMMGAHDAVVRFIRVRPGNISGTTLDGMGMATSDHCIIDHASISWTIDEAFSSRGAQNITLQRTLISEALNEAGHKNYPAGSHHGYAGSIGGKVGSFHHNLLAHNSGRNWSLAGGLDGAGHHSGWLDLRNNVVYNWDNRTTDGGAAKVNYVNNYYKPGPASHVFHLLKPERNNIQGFGPQDYYVAGNIMEGHVGADDAWGGIVEPNPGRTGASGDRVLEHDDAKPMRYEPLRSFVKEQPFFEPYVTTDSAAAAFKLVLSDVGCNQPVLDDHDTRVVRETRDGTVTYHGSKTKFPGLPDSQEDVGGWENYPEVHRPADFDRDHDGLPDWWETLHHLNPTSLAGSLADANADLDGDGYTELEDYLNWMAQPHMVCASGAVVELDLSTLTSGFSAKPAHQIIVQENGTADLAPDGLTLRFTPQPGFRGFARVVFRVSDATGDALTRTLGIAVQ